MSDDTTTSAATTFAPLPDEQSSTSGTQPTGQTLASTGVKHIAITREQIESFGIPEEWIAKNPALIDLILTTESMKDDERKYWFQLLPVMTDEQVTKLVGILQNERDQLAALDAKYSDEVAKLNDKYLAAWKIEQAAKKRKDIEAAEAVHATADVENQADILSQIESL